MAYNETAVPRASLDQISPKAALTLLTADEPNTPAKKRVMKTDAAFVLVAVPMENSARQNIAGKIDNRRPQISEHGAHTNGPRANPMLESTVSESSPWPTKHVKTHTYRDTFRTTTSSLTPIYAAMVWFAGAIMLEARLAVNANMLS